jgi:DNA-binding transcriptional ArsR family regulator
MATERPRVSASTSEDAYADNAMTWLLGDHPKAKILTVLVGKDYRELNAQQLCDLAGIRRESFEEHVTDLLDFGVVESRKVDEGQAYRLNANSELAGDLKELQFDLLSAVADSGAN